MGIKHIWLFFHNNVILKINFDFWNPKSEWVSWKICIMKKLCIDLKIFHTRKKRVFEAIFPQVFESTLGILF